MSKVGQTIAGFLIPSLLIIGADISKATTSASTEVAVTGEIGVRVTAIVAAVFCLLGLLLFLLYNEKQVMSTLAKKEKLSNEQLKEANAK
jgi:preprotein translocase subunit SecG